MITDSVIKHSVEIHQGVAVHLPERDVIFLEESYTNFILEATRKFARGQHEHGGRIIDRRIDQEIDGELIDLFHYNNARKFKKKHIIKELNVLSMNLSGKTNLTSEAIGELKANIKNIIAQLENL